MTSIFVSYSWDSIKHQKWVKKLVDDLNTAGFEATMDNLKTEYNTVHLGEMMASSIHKNDYTLVVMTPEYADRANSGQGGVGTETRYIMNLMKENQNRVIPIIRNGKDSNAIPFYLEQINYIDFRDNEQYKDRFGKLLKRLEHEDLNENLYSKFISEVNTGIIDHSTEIPENKTNKLKTPDLRKITEFDKSQFIRDAFEYLRSELKIVLKDTKKANNNFDFMTEDANSKIILKLYVDGSLKVNYKIWAGSLMSNTESIYISHNRISIGVDNQVNEVVEVEEINGKLRLRRMMDFNVNKQLLTKEELVDSLWEEIVSKL